MATNSSDIDTIRRRLGIADPVAKVVSLDDITLDKRCQARVAEPKGVARDYAEAYKRGDELPPLEVVHDVKQGRYYCVDGWSRYRALRKLHVGQTDCLVYGGTIDDAIRLAARANATHGEKRTPEDTAKAVLMMAKQCPHWSHSRLARWVGCSRSTVLRVMERGGVKQPPVKQVEIVRGDQVFESIVRTDGTIAKRRAQREKRIEAQLDAPPEPVKIEYVRDTPEPAWAPKPAAPTERTDMMGYVGPHRVAGVFTDNRKEIVDAAKMIADARNTLLGLKQRNATGLLAVSQNHLEGKCDDLAAVGKWLLGQAPYAVCPYCNGRGEGCRACGGRGWMTKREWEVSDETLRQQRKLAIEKQKGDDDEDSSDDSD